MKPDRFLGRSVDSLQLKERWQLSGRWVAVELYSPATLPVRVIEALGDSPQECARQLEARGLDPSHYEFHRIAQPYMP